MSTIKRFSPALKSMIKESARICFDDLPVVTHRTGFKILKQRPYGPIIKEDRIKDMRKGFRAVAPDFKTDLEERRIDLFTRLKRRGKSPPKKGHGKRASKKKK